MFSMAMNFLIYGDSEAGMSKLFIVRVVKWGISKSLGRLIPSQQKKITLQILLIEKPSVWSLIILQNFTKLIGINFPISFSEWSGRCIKFWRGIYSWAAEADSPQGRQKPDWRRAASLPGFHLPGGLVLS